MMAKKSRPYVMPGVRWPGIAPRKTVEDPPDYRITQVRVPALAADVIKIKLRHGPIDPYLRGIDRCMWRWTVTPGTTMPGPMLAQVQFSYGQSSRPTALGDRDCEMVDRAVKESPGPYKQVVILWYRTDRPAQEIAQMLGSQRRQTAYDRLNLALAYMLGRLEQMGLRGLRLDTVA